MIASLDTERLHLVPVSKAHADVWWSAIWSDAEVTRYLPPKAPIPREEVDQIITHCEAAWRANGFGIWVIEDKDTGALLGHIGLAVNEPPVVEVFYALSRATWGRGVATEAVAKIADHALTTMELPAIVALTFTENVGSQRVLEKVGFSREGRVHRHDEELRRYVLRCER